MVTRTGDNQFGAVNRILWSTHPWGVSLRTSLYIGFVLAVIIFFALYMRLPGIDWMIGYGHHPEQSFNFDDGRFVISARSFEDPTKKPDGYPLFMTTQLYVIGKIANDVFHVNINYVILLRYISMTYAVFTIFLCFIFCHIRGFSLAVSILSAFFLAASPVHIVQSHFGTPDISILLLFYSTILTAWLYQRSKREAWFYTASALAGVAMADKFFLPALVPPLLLIIAGPRAERGVRVFQSACTFITFFCVASFFNYTPWDFDRLLEMLVYDNLVVAGGKSPLQQIILYPWDLISATGLITSVFALFGLVALITKRRSSGPWFGLVGDGPRSSFASIQQRLRSVLKHPDLCIGLPLLMHALLILIAQVHFSRHILVFVPVICVVAAIGFATLTAHLRAASKMVRNVGFGLLTFLLVAIGVNGVLTDWPYLEDIRTKVVRFLADEKPGVLATTLTVYTKLRGVELVEDLPRSPLFVTCDNEYGRYLTARDANAVFHAWGGQARMDFYHALFSGQTVYRKAVEMHRQRYSLEDYLAGKGWLPKVLGWLPNTCVIFERQAIPNNAAAAL